MGTNKTIGITIDPRMDLNKLRQDANITGRIIEDLNRKISSASSPQIAAQDLFSSFATKARGYTTSAPEMMRSIYDQQRSLFEQRHSVRQSAIAGINQRYKEGRLPKDVYQELTSGYKEKDRQDKLILNELKNIVNTVKTAAKEEIIEDRKNVEETIRKSSIVNRYIQSGDDPYQAVKQTIQQRLLGDLSQEERRQKGFNLGGAGRGITNIGGALAEGNIGGALGTGGRMAVSGMSGVGLGGGIALGALATVLLGSAWSFMENKNIARDLRDYSITKGIPTGDIFDVLKDQAKNGNWSKMGYTSREAMQAMPGYLKVYGGDLPESQLREFLGLIKSRNVSSEQIGGLLGVNRYSKDSSQTSDLVVILEKYLNKTNQSVIRLGEVMGTYGSIANRYIQTTGSFNAGRLMSGVTGLGSSYGVQGINLDRFVTGFQGAFSRSDNPQIQALQFRAMAETMPGASMWSMQRAMNKPLENIGYINNLKGTIERMYKGSPDQGKQTMLSIFKPFGFSEEDIDRFYGKPLKAGDLNVGKSEGEKLSYAKEAEKYTAASEVLSNKLIDTMDILNATVGELPEKIANAFNIAKDVERGLDDYNKKHITFGTIGRNQWGL
jgi:hypothetical protein